MSQEKEWWRFGREKQPAPEIGVNISTDLGNTTPQNWKRFQRFKGEIYQDLTNLETTTPNGSHAVLIKISKEWGRYTFLIEARTIKSGEKRQSVPQTITVGNDQPFFVKEIGSDKPFLAFSFTREQLFLRDNGNTLVLKRTREFSSAS